MSTMRGLVAGALGLLAAGCTAGIVQKEDMLIAAGFQYRAADTTARIAALQRLPAHRFVRQERNGSGYWIYADPTVCRCVYAGSDQAFSNYQQAVFAQRLSDQNLMAAQINRDAVLDQYALGPWGPWAPFYY